MGMRAPGVPHTRSSSCSRHGEAGFERALRQVLWTVGRVVVWMTALVSSFVLVGIPARKLGYLSNQQLLDVVTKHGVSRFVPLVAFVGVWALLTSTLVHLFLDVRPRRRRRRTLDDARR
jgi:hypothetical protein